MGKDETEIERIFPLRLSMICHLDELQKFGITFKKAVYIQSMTRKIVSGEFNIQELETMSDEEICTKLSELDGIWHMDRRNVNDPFHAKTQHIELWGFSYY